MTARRYYSGRDYRRTLNIEELRRVAARHVPAFAFEYVEGGAEDEQALARNRSAFDDYRFAPRTLVNTEARHCRRTLFGRDLPFPVVIAPTGLNAMLRRDGDLKLARAAARAGIPFTLSTMSNALPETIVAASGQAPWMQLYMLRDPAITESIVGSAEAAGCEALMFTTDANVFGSREWDKRCYRAPARLTLRHALDVARHPRWLTDVIGTRGFPRFVNIAKFLPPEAQSTRGGVMVTPGFFGPAIDWDDVARLRDRWPRRLLIKGILDASDVERALTLGCDGVVLTNHGGRQLDSSVAPLEVLAPIARAYRGRIAILIDSGFRRGSDIAKAIALGADAVMVGRATLYGLAAGGEAGAYHAIELLRSELDRVLGQLGCRSLDELTAPLTRI